MLDMLNKTRLALNNEVRSNVNPSQTVILHQLLQLEVLMMENKYKQNFSDFFEENHNNLAVLLNNLVIKNQEAKGKKFNAKWTS